MRRRTLAGYLRPLNPRSYPVTNIKPDTSLYTDLPSRLRAMALVLEGDPSRLQKKSKLAWPFEWEKVGSTNSAGMISDNVDYRLKPAPPARLYVDITDDGRPAHTYDRPLIPMPGTTRVIYVLENPDANG